MTPFGFWTLVIVGGSAALAMLATAFRMIWQQRSSPPPISSRQRGGE